MITPHILSTESNGVTGSLPRTPEALSQLRSFPRGMERSRAAGLASFDIGDVSSTPETTAKERSIAYFKRGFTDRLMAAITDQTNRARSMTEEVR